MHLLGRDVGFARCLKPARAERSTIGVDVVRHDGNHGAIAAVVTAQKDEISSSGEHAETLRAFGIVPFDILEIQDVRVEVNGPRQRPAADLRNDHDVFDGTSGVLGGMVRDAAHFGQM